MISLYGSVTGVSDIESISITATHDSSTTTAIVSCKSHTLTLGDAVTIDMGYSTEHKVLFTGYVKQISRTVPDTLWSITCSDVMTKAIDFFIAGTDPNAPLTYQNISAETLVGNLLALANLTDYTYDATNFIFGVADSFEVNLVSVHDYCRRIADLLTWNLWADQTGKVHFENRKPYVMLGTSGQPGDVADIPNGIIITDIVVTNISYSKDSQKLRNKVIVYGSGDLSATASAVSPYLPTGFYKTTVLAAPGLIDTVEVAQQTADYNLNLLNRLTEEINVEIVGDPNFEARTVTTISSTKMGITEGDWYIFSCQQTMARGSGFTTALILRK